MSEDFAIIFEFLKQFEAEVRGRGETGMDGALRERLARLAEGQCDVEERTELCRLLVENPAWLEFLADAVKSKRPERNK